MAKKKTEEPQATEQPQEQFDQHEQPEQQLEPVEIAANTMLGDLMKVVIDLAKALPKSWAELSETQQDMWLNSVDAQCRMAIRQVVQIIASEGCARIPVQIAACTIKKGVEVKVELVNHHDVISMLEAETKTAMLVLANSDNFTAEAGKPKAEKDQRSLDLGKEYTDGDGDGMQASDDNGGEAQDELYETAVDTVRASGKASISSIQAALQIGYNRAARLVEAMEAAGVVSKPDGKGARTVLDAEADA